MSSSQTTPTEEKTGQRRIAVRRSDAKEGHAGAETHCGLLRMLPRSNMSAPVDGPWRNANADLSRTSAPMGLQRQKSTLTANRNLRSAGYADWAIAPHSTPADEPLPHERTARLGRSKSSPRLGPAPKPSLPLQLSHGSVSTAKSGLATDGSAASSAGTEVSSVAQRELRRDIGPRVALLRDPILPDRAIGLHYAGASRRVHVCS